MVDVSTPVTNPQLVLAIKQMQQNNTEETRARMIAEVKQAHFISPVIISPTPDHVNEDTKVTLKEKTTISFSMIGNEASQQFFLAFTDWEELGKWKREEDQQVVVLTFNDFAAMALDGEGSSCGFVINPFGENVVFDKAIMRAIRDEGRNEKGGASEYIIEKETAVHLGQPREYPYELVGAISYYLKGQKNVKAAYLQLMEKEGEQSYLLIVDFAGDRRTLFDGIANAAMKHLNGMFIDMIPYDADFGLSATKNIKPFYRRKRFGLF